MAKEKYLEEVTRRFGAPRIDYFGPDSGYRVWVQHGWHYHDGAVRSDPSGQGRTPDKASQRLLEILKKPGVVLVKGKCDWKCSNDYSGSKESKVAVESFWRRLKEDAKRFKETEKHEWGPGPDGKKYHCYKCTLSKCDDWDAYPTCESYVKRKAKSNPHELLNGIQALVQYLKNK